MSSAGAASTDPVVAGALSAGAAADDEVVAGAVMAGDASAGDAMAGEVTAGAAVAGDAAIENEATKPIAAAAHAWGARSCRRRLIRVCARGF